MRVDLLVSVDGCAGYSGVSVSVLPLGTGRTVYLSIVPCGVVFSVLT